MVNHIIAEGDKIEFTEILSQEEDRDGKKANTYVSQLFDFLDNGNLRVAMPISKGRLIPLSKGLKYDIFFYTSKGLFQSKALIVDRYKSGNIYTMEIELTTELQKYQRRQFYRLEKTLQLHYVKLSDEDYHRIIKTRKFPENLKDIEIYEKGTSADISGGGMRFVGRTKIDTGSKVFVIFDIMSGDTYTKFHLPATVILSFELQNKMNYFEHRVEFENISKDYRELLIRYIFEEERKLRQNTR